MVPSPRVPRRFAAPTGDGGQPALFAALPERIGAPEGDCMLPASTPALLADLASQHERLQQMFGDVTAALAEAQVTVGQAWGALQGAELSDGTFVGVPVLEGELGLVGSENCNVTLAEHAEATELPSDGQEEASVPILWDSRAEGAVARRSFASAKSLSKLPAVASGEHLSADDLIEAMEVMDRGSKGSNRSGSKKRRASLVDLREQRAPSQRTSGSYSDDDPIEAWSQVRQNAVFRLQARLGRKTLKGLVTSQDIYRAIRSLGLDKYDMEDIADWLTELDSAIILEDNGMEVKSFLSRKSHLKTKAKVMLGIRWPRSRGGMRSDSDNDLSYSDQPAVSFLGFTKLLLDDGRLSTLNKDVQEMSLTIREVLFSGDANRLVAELTNLRVDEVAMPPEKLDMLSLMEPIIACVIVLNGLVIGLQSGSDDKGINTFFWCNVCFTAFFSMEIVVRSHLLGCAKTIAGPDRWWNAFDSLMVLLALFDLVVEALFSSRDFAPVSVMRLMRLTRLARLVRIFRLRRMKELSLMLRGLLGGLYTLFWAVVLLFFTLYMIACIATATIGKADLVPQIAKDRLFSSVWSSFFTCFRCFSGDCNTSEGMPIAKLLSDAYGVTFTLAYFASNIFVVFGIFNLIVAIYIENTMNAAKTEGEKSKAQRQRESVRIARLTRQLLKKFCAIERLWSESHNGDAKEVKKIMTASNFADVSGLSATVTKDMFLTLIQDASVQKLMDDLDIPPERASLFDILDADGSGGLEVIELITGLLRVRGEAKKSDAVGTLLAVRVVQDMIRDIGDRVATMEEIVAGAPSGGDMEAKPSKKSTFEQQLRARIDSPA